MFLDENNFKENDFFFLCLVVFRKMFQKIFYSVVRKIEQKRQGWRRAFLENDLRKNWT